MPFPFQIFAEKAESIDAELFNLAKTIDNDLVVLSMIKMKAGQLKETNTAMAEELSKNNAKLREV